MDDRPFKPLVEAWRSKLRIAREKKYIEFGKDAEEAMFFYESFYDEMYGPRRGAFGRGFVPPEDTEDFPKPTFCMTVNKVAEMVQIFGPALYHRNPVRKVTPRKPPELSPDMFGNPADPNAQMMLQQVSMQMQASTTFDRTVSALLESYLNLTPTALDLKSESRLAIDETIIKGAGLLWTELYHPQGAQFAMIGSFYDSIDNLLVDPDVTELSEAKWIAKRCIHPVWEVEDEYGLPRGTLKGTAESYSRQADIDASDSGIQAYKRQTGTNDLITYWKVWSKMGMGGNLKESPTSNYDIGALGAYGDSLEVFGKFCYLVIADNVSYPLNLPPDLTEVTQDDQLLAQQVQWPTPFWVDDSWPFTMISFHRTPRKLWPMSHVKPGLGELKFINWAYSMLASKVRVAHRDFLAILKGTSEETRYTLTKGGDYSVIELENLTGAIDNVVKFLQHPEFNPAIYTVIQAVEGNLEKRFGLTELAYGMTTKGMRSAAEAETKANQLSVRPDDMANKVEDAMSEIARKEAFAARWHLQPQDIAPVMGDVPAMLWQQVVMPSDPSHFLHQLDYRIEAASMKKPNRDKEIGDMQQAMQTLFTPLYQYAQQTGNVGPVNKLITDWAKSLDLDASGYLLSAPPPPGPAPAPPQQPRAA